MSESDIRLRRDIVLLGYLANGLPLYRFRYLWSDCAYVGVMAHEVMQVMPEAVEVGEDGFMRVRYDLLGIQMVTWAQWLREQSPRTMAA